MDVHLNARRSHRFPQPRGNLHARAARVEVPYNSNSSLHEYRISTKLASSTGLKALAPRLDLRRVLRRVVIQVHAAIQITERKLGDASNLSPRVRNRLRIAGNAWGQAYGTTPDNSTGELDYGWLGSAKRGFEHSPGISVIEMGARQYSPALGRFLEVDPIENGTVSNDYGYVRDPVNMRDLTGRYADGRSQAAWDWIHSEELSGRSPASQRPLSTPIPQKGRTPDASRALTLTTRRAHAPQKRAVRPAAPKPEKHYGFLEAILKTAIVLHGCVVGGGFAGGAGLAIAGPPGAIAGMAGGCIGGGYAAEVSGGDNVVNDW